MYSRVEMVSELNEPEGGLLILMLSCPCPRSHIHLQYDAVYRWFT